MLETEKIKEYAYSLGFTAARITDASPFPRAQQAINDRVERGMFAGLPWFTKERAEVSCHPDALLPEAQSIIALSLCYLTQQPDRAEEDDTYNDVYREGEEQVEGELRGRISRYAWGDDYHDIIKPRLQQFSAWLHEYAQQELGIDSETRLFVDTGRMVDRAAAERSGIGWYGKNTNILTHGWGSWVFLAEIVTNLPLEPDQPLKANCGKCEICLHACPTGALPRPYELDSTRCISFLTIELRGSIPVELRPLMGNLIYGCDICQEVCPVNKVAEKRLGLRDARGRPLIGIQNIKRATHTGSAVSSSEKKALTTDRPVPIQELQGHFQPRSATGTAPELIPLLAMTEEEFRERFRHSPIKRTKRRGLLRNVCVALGNLGDPRAVPALVNTLQTEEEPLIRGHAAWALGRIATKQARIALYNAQEREQDKEVQQEIAYALEMLEQQATVCKR